ncbi:undecaprenyldiphospho-muramoylpentapeptide beta-N-acetylglucosaminyltransferase [Niveibacterium sp. 24ML]|uniref:undecaprenyldiphospho-muramoylpentapeptide beta-N-acetylglucosaminyltransferase n=1 Tax=Niveibacterium sp. 24ML TaxID=2985512 RepID=UPI00227013F5|nr:undecaprenyldiphospho-muramoylpentapeptide beta-N-acetylglucosaminyltransferase [Niveibacterium sp. 24ML]MCX9157859.1 undecaprenyldiphospho-muramoylpentapeptide beta-N-acetylglucosaminyltransferase [Niveibacterium sp. 24ML]
MRPARTLMVMAAGTGGHIFPGLAIAQAMQARGWSVRWLGTTQGMESEIVPRHGIELDAIAFSGLRGKGIAHAVRGAIGFVASLFRCIRLVRAARADVVLGMGGYVTVPGGIAARLCGRPLALVNADAAPLLSNKLLGPFAQRVLFGFAGAFGSLAGKAVVTGNPVRQEICSLPEPAARYASRSGGLNILVVGGSLGARVLNETVPEALALMPPDQRPRVTHQAGKANIEALRQRYAALGIEAELLPFIDDMPQRLANADLVVCRAGAITAAELAAAGVASILVPLVVSTTSHQRDNAELLARAGAAIHLPQSQLTPKQLAAAIQGLDRAQCLDMASKARGIGRPDATERIADIIDQLAVGRHA